MISAQPAAEAPKVGIGMVYSRDAATGKYTVQSVTAGNAAAEAELRAGDRLIAIDGKPMEKMDQEQMRAMLLGGVANKPYTLSIERTIKTSLGEKVISKDVLLTPRAVTDRTCVSGDCKNGTGRLIKGNGFVFEGNFLNEVMVSGKLFYPSGRIATEGTYENGNLNGKNCTSYFDRGEKNMQMQGTFVKGKLKTGSYFLEDGKTVIEGEWDDDGKLHAKKVKVSGPWSYTGPAVHGAYTGDAEMTYLNGRYEGDVVDGKAHGKGRYFYGPYRYIGHFVNGLMEGKFRVVQKSTGGSYEGVKYYRAGVEQ